ncbi:MAG: hypothetical protein EBR82_09405 [Caulobacteraceae bacterium]|nr:hypothetical protein [Caulobacteraceae bacterium]
MAQPFNTDRFVKFVGGFAAKGPFVGWLVVWIEILAVGAFTTSLPRFEGWPVLLQGLGGLIGGILLSFALAYGLGVVPAVVTAVVCHPLSRIRMPIWGWVAACAAVGAMVSALVLFAFTRTFGPDLLLLGATILPGAAAAAVCAWQARGRRLSL